jgi:hypothetical protein
LRELEHAIAGLDTTVPCLVMIGRAMHASVHRSAERQATRTA